MSLRLRLIAAFFLFSVVPLAALTTYGYIRSLSALHDAAGKEAEVLAGELSNRMQVVTTQLGSRVEGLMALSPPSEPVQTSADPASDSDVAAAETAAEQADDRVAATLGELALLLDNVEVRDRGFGRGGRGNGRGTGGTGRGTGRGGDRDLGRGDGPPPRGAQPAPEPPPSASPETDPDEGITIDMMPIRREILEQYGSREEWQQLPEEERQRILGEVNQRMLGVALGIRMGAAEAQRRVVEAQRAADAKAKEAATSARIRASQSASRAAARSAAAQPAGLPTVATVSATGATLRRTLSNGRLDVTVERDGQIVQQVNAAVNVQNLLGMVFGATRPDRGEVPFAVSKDGHLYAASAGDQQLLEDLETPATRPEPAPGTTVTRGWIIVTTADPTGLGLKFGVARPVGDLLQELWRTTMGNAAIGLGFIVLALIAIVPLSGRLTRDVSSLGEGVRRIAIGDYRARVPVRSHDEIGRLAAAFNQMAGQVELHQRDAVGQERIRRELELGRQIQHEMLPRVPLQVGRTEIKGLSVPAREVGGDFFNYFEVADGRIALVVGDVSGKGVGAALLMANIQASLRTRLVLGQNLCTLADETDRDIEATTPGAVYATLFVGLLNPVTYEFTYVNAGHHAQYVLSVDGSIQRMPATGMPVGLFAGRGYEEGRMSLAPGDVLFFYTDGCVETEREDGEQFGAERLEALLRSAAAAQPAEVLTSVERSLTAFRGGREPFDDATMMAARVG